jgi:2-keto-4-pentenoate hydratase/2-oxohepta-3-ene-1,7-dioic acid hydratase in catechol pathway
MKIASFDHQNIEKLGIVLADDRLVDIEQVIAAMGDLPKAWARDMISLIESGPAGLLELQKIADWAAAHPDKITPLADSDVVWQPPVRRPSKICCLALNNSANAERIISGPKHPAIFVKAANALVGHGQPIQVKQQYGRVHPEPELALIISKTAKDIDPAEAYDYVFGYTAHNDITSPVMRAEDTFHYRAIHPADNGSEEIKYIDSFVSYSGRYKGSDSFSPLGPWLVTRDEIDNPHDLTVTCRHQGRIVTEDNTRNLFHQIPAVLAFISTYMTLYPGDVVSLGTALKPAGAGGKAVQNVDLLALGGPISVTIEKIGTLSNSVHQTDTAEALS